MNDDPREIDVLYGCVHDEDTSPGLLQNLADGLVEHFYKAGEFQCMHSKGQAGKLGI